MTSPTMPVLQSDHLSTFLLFMIMTGMFVLVMVSIGKSFEFVKKPMDNEPPFIRLFTTTYLLVFNEILLIYIYFIFLCFILKDNRVLGGFVKFLFVAVTIGLSFIVMGYASDALKKINELPNGGSYKEYTKLLTMLVSISVILIVVCFFWIMMRVRNARANAQSVRDLNILAGAAANIRRPQQQKQKQKQLPLPAAAAIA